MKKKKQQTKIKNHPARILSLGFLIVIFIGSILLNLPQASQDGQSVGWMNAIFTATSATCVTGLVVVDTGTHWTFFGQFVILVLIQIGGLGFMTFATLFAIIIGKRITYTERVIIQESLNQFKIQGVVKLSKYIFFTTIAIEFIGALLLSTVFIPELGVKKGIWFSIFHAISAFCNAGFDLNGNFSSLTSYATNPILNIVIIMLIITGGLGFVVILDIMKKRKFKKYGIHSKFVLTLTGILLSVGFVLFFLLEFNNPKTIGDLNFGGKLLTSFFQSVTPRTAGFNTIDLSQMEDTSKLITMIFMFIGGSSGSTAGGIKITTFGVAVLMIVSAIKGKTSTNVYKRKIANDITNKAITIIGLGLSLVLIVTIILTITEKQDFMVILFEAVSAFGTVGLSLGLTPDLTFVGKMVIAVTMFFGRLGPLTVFLALAYNRDNLKEHVKYPEGKIIVG